MNKAKPGSGPSDFRAEKYSASCLFQPGLSVCTSPFVGREGQKRKRLGVVLLDPVSLVRLNTRTRRPLHRPEKAIVLLLAH